MLTKMESWIIDVAQRNPILDNNTEEQSTWYAWHTSVTVAHTVTVTQQWRHTHTYLVNQQRDTKPVITEIRQITFLLKQKWFHLTSQFPSKTPLANCQLSPFRPPFPPFAPLHTSSLDVSAELLYFQVLLVCIYNTSLIEVLYDWMLKMKNKIHKCKRRNPRL